MNLFKAINEKKGTEIFFDSFAFAKKFFGSKYFENRYPSQVPFQIEVINKTKSKKSGIWIIDKVFEAPKREQIKYGNPTKKGFCAECGIKINIHDELCTKCYEKDLIPGREIYSSSDEFQKLNPSNKIAKDSYNW